MGRKRTWKEMGKWERTKKGNYTSKMWVFKLIMKTHITNAITQQVIKMINFCNVNDLIDYFFKFNNHDRTIS